MNAIQVLKNELVAQHLCEMSIKTGNPQPIDVLLVVKDQIDYVRRCVETLFANTDDFQLYIWDNDSGAETSAYLDAVADTHANVILVKSTNNIGFLKPNNNLAALGTNPWIVLLNSDTEVARGWDTAMIGWLREHPSVGAVAYEGGLMGRHGVGIGVNDGDEVDYLAAWCMCLNRDLYRHFGLFDGENLSFAYGEDSDFCLRLKESGLRIHALQLKYVRHHGNKTSAGLVMKEMLKPHFQRNHQYIRRRWADYIANRRVLLKYPDLDAESELNISKCPFADCLVDVAIEAQ